MCYVSIKNWLVFHNFIKENSRGATSALIYNRLNESSAAGIGQIHMYSKHT